MGQSMGNQVRVNVSTRVNNADIRWEKRDGREYVIVPSATLPDNVVMNRILYSAEEIEKGYQTLERTPAPMGHPKVGDVYISAREPEAINGFWVGAHNENVRRQNGRVFVDKAIDVETARSTEKGRQLLDAISKKEPIHTSTGVLLVPQEVEHDDYDMIATDIILDHDAFLLSEKGAATPSQGVGVFVNSEGERVEVQNATITEEDMLEMVDWMAWDIVDRAERQEEQERKKPLFESVKAKIVDALKIVLSSTDEGAAGLAVNRNGEDDMSVTKEEFEAFKAEMLAAVNAKGKDEPVADDLKATVNEAVKEAVKPIQDQMTANAEAEKAKAKAEHEAAVNKVVEAEILEKEVAETMDTVALNALAEKFGKPGAAYGVNGKFGGGSDKFNPDDLAPEA